MANEEVNWHTHDAGLFRWDWNYWTDKSVDDAAAEIYSHAKEPSGVTVDHVMNFIRSATDGDQMTDREARMLVGVLRVLVPDMTLEAKRLVDTFTRRMHDLRSDIFDMSDEQFADYENSWIGTGLRTGAGDALLSGEELKSFLGQLDRQAHPWKEVDDVDWSKLVNIGGFFQGG